MLRKFKRVFVQKPWKSAKTVGKDSVYKSGGLYCVYMDRKRTVYKLEASKI